MRWDWARLSDVVRRLKLPAGEYAVDRVGYGLSLDRYSSADHVDLLVTEVGWRRLKERGWRERRGGTEVRHPKEPGLSARVVALADVRHEISIVDEVPVIAVEPDPVASEPETARQWMSTAVLGMVLMAVIATMVYGFTVLEPTPPARVMMEHLSFQTTQVEARVEESSQNGECRGVQAYDRSPRIYLRLSWVEDGKTRTAPYRGCGASVESPQDIWVSADGVVASQNSPWADHFWPVLAIAIVPFAFILQPILGWWHGRRRRRT